jgi:hypothetical protein
VAHFSHSNIGFNIVPPLPVGSKISLAHNPQMLSKLGFNIPVIITSVPLDKNVSQSKSVLVMAHFDTGASVTNIDEKLARELELFPIGEASIQTAGGLKDTKKYIVSISFPNTALRGYKLSVNDCNLPYNGNVSDLNPQNFSVLLGRDIMSNWNIVWNGPTSTVLISD